MRITIVGGALLVVGAIVVISVLRNVPTPDAEKGR